MGIRLYLPDSMSRMTKGKSSFEVNGNTVGECLAHLVVLMPGVEKSLFYHSGEKSLLRSHVKVTVNRESFCGELLDKEVKNNDEIHIRIERN